MMKLNLKSPGYSWLSGTIAHGLEFNQPDVAMIMQRVRIIIK